MAKGGGDVITDSVPMDDRGFSYELIAFVEVGRTQVKAAVAFLINKKPFTQSCSQKTSLLDED
jgi:hypothetical protein